MRVKVKMPKLGLTMTEATVLEWRKAVGDRVTAGEPLLVIETEKAEVELEAPGYLVVADNRDDGACCDSRAIGWIPAEAIRGRVLVRLTSNPEAAPDLDPAARGLQWKP